jgi:hypothetical protein
MTRRPAKSQRARKAPARKRAASKRVAGKRVARKPQRGPATSEPLDDFIAAGARALDLKVAKAWLPAVRANLEVTLRLGAMVATFPLPDDAEPAPVFVA